MYKQAQKTSAATAQPATEQQVLDVAQPRCPVARSAPRPRRRRCGAAARTPDARAAPRPRPASAPPRSTPAESPLRRRRADRRARPSERRSARPRLVGVDRCARRRRRAACASAAAILPRARRRHAVLEIHRHLHVAAPAGRQPPHVERGQLDDADEQQRQRDGADGDELDQRLAARARPARRRSRLRATAAAGPPRWRRRPRAWRSPRSRRRAAPDAPAAGRRRAARRRRAGRSASRARRRSRPPPDRAWPGAASCRAGGSPRAARAARACARGSRLPVGSSPSRIAGSPTMARATATRCCSPPESDAARASSLRAEPDRVERRPPRERAPRACGSPRISSGMATLSQRRAIAEQLEVLKDDADVAPYIRYRRVARSRPRLRPATSSSPRSGRSAANTRRKQRRLAGARRAGQQHRVAVRRP